MVKGLIASVIAIGLQGMPIATKEAVVYDDMDTTIVLSADELNDNSFANLVALCDVSTYYTSYVSSLTYNSVSYTFDTANQYYNSGANPSSICLPISYIGDVNNKFYIGTYGVGEFEYDLVINFVDGIAYETVKQAIESDLPSQEENMPSVSDLFGYITQGVTNFVQSLGQAFTSVTALFWDSTGSAPTFVGLLMLVAIGAGLIYLAFNVVRGLVRRLRG